MIFNNLSEFGILYAVQPNLPRIDCSYSAVQLQQGWQNYDLKFKIEFKLH
jgi:hypothetical protein